MLYTSYGGAVAMSNQSALSMRYFILMLGVWLAACSPAPTPAVEAAAIPAPLPVVSRDTVVQREVAPPVVTYDYDTTQWLELTDLDATIQLDIRYATANNFVGEVLYDCGRCFLRPAVARAVVAAHQELATDGLRLKMYDCYRPRPIQYKMWKIYPRPGYVANPDKGSVHNRGGAVDLTIVDSLGHELAMGTDYDHFGREANHTYYDLPKEVLANRTRLRELMERHGLAKIRTEWWHYNYTPQHYALAEWVWPCENTADGNE